MVTQDPVLEKYGLFLHVIANDQRKCGYPKLLCSPRLLHSVRNDDLKSGLLSKKGNAS